MSVKDKVKPKNDVSTAVEDSIAYVKMILMGILAAANVFKGADSVRGGFDEARKRVEAGLLGRAPVTTGRGRTHVAGQSATGIIFTVLAIGITVVIAVVITVVVDQTQSSTTMESQQLNDTSDTIVDQYANAVTLLGPVFIVLMLSIIVGALFGLLPGQGGG
jgi:hypothetical protein